MKTYFYFIFFLVTSLRLYSQVVQEKMIIILSNTTYSYYVDTSCISLPISCPKQFNDIGLQAIFDTYSIPVGDVGSFACNQTGFYNAIELYGMTTSTNTSFTQALLNYSGVVGINYLPGIPNQVYYKLIDNTIGSYVNIIGGVVVTNNTTLNQIFVDNNVYAINEYPQQNEIFCNYDGINLSNILNNLTSLMDYSFGGCGVVYLNNNNFQKSKTKIFPNPFSENLTIESPEIINSFRVYDSFGKKVVETSSKTDFEIKLYNLNSGIYFLNLVFENGQIENKKLIKK